MAQVMFNLLKLPLEIQLQVLEHCVVSDFPIVKFETRYKRRHTIFWSEKNYHQDYEIHGHDKCIMNIIFTCHFYLTEGWKIFWSQNKFLYTSIHELPIYQLTSMASFLRHLSFRLDVVCFGRAFKGIIKVLQECEHFEFKALKTLRIHLITDYTLPGWVPYYRGPHRAFVDAVRFYRSYQVLKGTAEHQPKTTISDEFSRTKTWVIRPHSAIVDQLDEFVVDGLADDVMRLNAMVLRLVSTAVNPLGRIGLGIGEKGRSYYQIEKHGPELLRVEGGPELTWIRFEEVDDWISEHARPSYDNTTDDISGNLRRSLHDNMSTTDPLFKGWSWA